MNILLLQISLLDMSSIGIIFLSYIVGSIPFGLILAKLCGAGDIRSKGSGNIGATNALRVGGKKLGILTLIFDMLKGAVPLFLASYFGAPIYLAGLAAILGHMFPVWLNFKGGKGVATTLGMLLALNWKLGAAFIISWVIIFLIKRYSSLSSIVAISISTICTYFLYGDRHPIFIINIIIAILVIIKHIPNINRLIHGQEKKFNIGK